MSSLQTVEVDLDAYRANFRSIAARVAPAKAVAVVKADAYGHGAVPIARAAVQAGAEWLGVVSIDEALRLRGAGISEPRILSWLHAPGADFAAATRAGITLGLSTVDQLQAAAAVRAGRVHLVIDTGLNRNGARREQWPEFFAAARRLSDTGAIEVEGFMSHLSNTSWGDDSRQLDTFAEALAVAHEHGVDPALRHIAATGVALDRPEARYDMVRIGIGAYGLSPDDRSSAELGLRPVMRVAARVVNVKRVPAGEGVSYGYIYRTPRETTLALVAFGYADGLPRQASGAGAVRVGEHTYPLAGRIAMDQCVVDVGDAPVRIGDEAVILGDPERGEPSASLWAASADTINYEIVTRIGARPGRVYRGE